MSINKPPVESEPIIPVLPDNSTEEVPLQFGNFNDTGRNDTMVPGPLVIVY